jgi:hypothetical protein
MKKIDLGQSITILANVGVIGGLIFVGMQLSQDRDIAIQQMVYTSTDQFSNWAELVTNNSDLWSKGLSGEPLTSGEEEQFNALAEAWHMRHYSGFYGTSQVGRAGIGPSFPREAARKIHENPGLLRWWRSFAEFQREVGRGGGYDDLVNEELRRLGSQSGAH